MEKPLKKLKEKPTKKVKISEKSKPLKKRRKEEEEEVDDDEDDDEADDDEVGDEINNADQKLRDGPLKDKEAENVKVEAVVASGSISPAQITEEDNSTCDSLYQVPPAAPPVPPVPPSLVDMRNHYQQLYPGYPMMNPEMYQQRTFRPFPSADLGPAASGSQQNY